MVCKPFKPEAHCELDARSTKKLEQGPKQSVKGGQVSQRYIWDVKEVILLFIRAKNPDWMSQAGRHNTIIIQPLMISLSALLLWCVACLKCLIKKSVTCSQLEWKLKVLHNKKPENTIFVFNFLHHPSKFETAADLLPVGVNVGVRLTGLQVLPASDDMNMPTLL